MRFKNDEVELAGTGRRFWALCVDGLALAILVSVVTGALGLGDSGDVAGTGTNGESSQEGALFLLASFFYYWYFWTRSGQTPGQRMLGVRVIRLDGELMTGTDALARYLVRLIGGFCFALGFIWAFSDRLNQTWHDKAAGTVVIREGTIVVFD